jgi:hypothetical protein
MKITIRELKALIKETANEPQVFDSGVGAVALEQAVKNVMREVHQGLRVAITHPDKKGKYKTLFGGVAPSARDYSWYETLQDKLKTRGVKVREKIHAALSAGQTVYLQDNYDNGKGWKVVRTFKPSGNTEPSGMPSHDFEVY